MTEFNPGPNAPGSALPEPEGPCHVVYVDGILRGMADDRLVQMASKAAAHAGSVVIASATRCEISEKSGRSTVFEIIP